LLFTVMLKLDTVLLSLLTNSHDVGIYGSAYRLFESTMFLSWSLGAAIFPWFSRIHPERVDDLRRGYETSVIVMLGLLVPVGVAFLLLAEPIIQVIYGAAYDGAVLPLRLLSIVVVCYGLNAITSNVLTAHDRPGLMHRVLLITLVQNIVMNLVLIPLYGPTGAALSAAVSGILLGALTLRQAATALGFIDLTRIFLAPVLGGTAMALVVLLLGADLLKGLLFGIPAYALAFLLTERALFPDDFVRLRSLVRLRKAEA
jgi:O-antigen/teichoic acid export membrane protein